MRVNKGKRLRAGAREKFLYTLGACWGANNYNDQQEEESKCRPEAG